MPLTSTGLTVRRQPDVLSDLENDQRTLISSDIDTRDDELFGQINSIVSLLASNVEQTIQAGWDNLDLDTAEGVWLDKKGRDKGLIRLQDSYSFTYYQKFEGDNGAVVPAGTVIRNSSTKDEYTVATTIPLSNSSCYNITYTVGTLSNNTTYYISVNTTVYSYVSDATATKLEILNGLKALIDADSLKPWAATVDTVNERITVTSTDLNKQLVVLSTSNLSIYRVGNTGYIEATEVGAISAPANSIVEFVTTAPGVALTTNLQDVVIGRLRETDVEFRTRIYESLAVKSVATTDAIYSRLRNVPGVTMVQVLTNPTSTTDVNGIPPYTYECVVVGGDDTAVAQEIWDTKSAAQPIYGNTSILITDLQGNSRGIDFSRPVAKNIAFKVSYTTYSEESLSVNLEEEIESAILAYIGGLGIDVIPPRYFGPIYNNTTGLETITVEVQFLTNPGDTPAPGSWQTTPLAIGNREYGVSQASDIYVVAL